MKISKYIFICMVSLCLTGQGVTFSRLCLGPGHGPGHSDNEIVWARQCHAQIEDTRISGVGHAVFFDRQQHGCIDLAILSAAGFGGSLRPDNKLHLTKPLVLGANALDHPGRSNDRTKQKTGFSPAFSDVFFLSLESTILII